MGRMKTARASTVLAIAVATGLFTFFALAFVTSGMEAIDDAYISFRYARNLVEGNGLVYNPGEAVQGYTNFLWVLLLAGSMFAGLPPVPVAAGLGFAAGVTTVVLTASWALHHLAPGRSAGLVAPVLLVSNLGFVVWSIRGLETALFAALVLGAGLVYLRRGPERAFPLPAAALLALATLTRPEGVLVAALTLLHAALARLRTGRRPITRRDLPALGLFGLVVGGYALWTLWYYGDLLPNTFYAKVGEPADSLERGWNYIKKFTAYATGRPLLLLPLALLWRPRSGWTRSYTALVAGGYGLYVVLIGGDVFPAYRFLVPVLPHLYLLVADAVAALEEAGLRLARRGPPVTAAAGVAAAGVALLLAALALSTHHPSSAFAWREWQRGSDYTRDMRLVGRWLGDRLPRGTWIAVNPAGALPYESRLPTIDMLGLNDREIARTPVNRLGSGRLAGHEKGNGESVFRRRPGIILIGGVKLETPPADPSWIPHGRSERELARLPDLQDVYRSETHPMPDGRLLTFLIRRDLQIGRPEAGS